MKRDPGSGIIESCIERTVFEMKKSICNTFSAALACRRESYEHNASMIAARHDYFDC